MPDYLMNALGVVAHIWCALAVISVISHLNDPRVKYFGAKININGWFFVPFIMVIVYWFWFFGS